MLGGPQIMNFRRFLLIACLCLIPSFGNAVTPMVAAGYRQTIALKNNGTLVAVGNDSAGQLGLGRVVLSSTPQEISALSQVRTVEAGIDHILALRQDGTVWAWGSNRDGQLGDGTTITYAYGYVIAPDGFGIPTGSRDVPTPAPVQGLTGVVAIAAGHRHSIARKQDGTVWAWGANYSGELGHCTTTTIQSTPAPVPGLGRVVAIAAGNSYTLALKQDGTVWAWGDNSSGQLGDGTTTNSCTPVPALGLNGVVAIAAGSLHGVALKQDGTVWAWGFNRNGQLGDGTTTDRRAPVRVSGVSGVAAIAAGGFTSLAIKNDGGLWLGELTSGVRLEMAPPSSSVASPPKSPN